MPNAAFSTQLIVRFGANKNEQNKKKVQPVTHTWGKRKFMWKLWFWSYFLSIMNSLYLTYSADLNREKETEGGANCNARSCWVMLVDSVLQTRHSSTLNANLLSSSNYYYYFSLKKKVPRVHKGRVIVEAKVDEEEEIRRRRRRTHNEVKCKYKL